MFVRAQQLAQEHYTKRIYTDTIKLDTFGYIGITDTLYRNKITSRIIRHNYKIPTITIEKEITKIESPKREFYVGGQINGNKENLIHSVQTGLLYKDRNDRIFTLNAGITITGQPYFGIGRYWKLGK